MKTVSILIPTYNEAENIKDIVQASIHVMTDKLPEYDYEVVVIDNASIDGTQEILRNLCKTDTKIKAILNAKNYGSVSSSFYGLLQCSGDAVVLITADFQDPPELIEVFVREWEKGAEVVLGQKKESETNAIMHLLRLAYYKIINKMSDVDLLEQCTEYGLYDKGFIELLREIEDNQPYLRGLVAKFSKKIKLVDYVQHKRRAGKSKFSFGFGNWHYIGTTRYGADEC